MHFSTRFSVVPDNDPQLSLRKKLEQSFHHRFPCLVKKPAGATPIAPYVKQLVLPELPFLWLRPSNNNCYIGLDLVTGVTSGLFTMKEKWILFSYSIPATNAKARMRIWRRISASGAVQLKTGLQILPNREDLLENITWLIGEVNALGGEALAIQCARIEGMEDDQIEKLFQNQIDQEFLQIQTEARALLTETTSPVGDEKATEFSSALRKLRKRCEALQMLDFFPSGTAVKTLAVLDTVSEKLRSKGNASAPEVLFDRSAYQGRIWATRAHPYIDRLSSAWLISRFIDSKAQFRFLQPGESAVLGKGEVAFDIRGGEFTHQGDLITFEIMFRGFGLLDSAILKISELVRFIDIQEGTTQPDDAGLLKNLLDGLVAISTDDHQLLGSALLVFDALYAGFSQKTTSASS